MGSSTRKSQDMEIALDPDPCFACGYCDFLTFSTHYLEMHTAAKHSGMIFKSASKRISIMQSALVREADALFYLPYLEGDSGNILLSNDTPPRKENSERQLSSRSITATTGEDLGTFQPDMDISSLSETVDDDEKEAKPQIKSSSYTGSKSAGNEIGSTHLDQEDVPSIKQETCSSHQLEIVEGLPTESTDKETSNNHESNIFQDIDPVKAEFVEKLSSQLLSLVQEDRRLIKDKSSNSRAMSKPKYDLKRKTGNDKERNRKFPVDQPVVKRLRRNVPRRNYKEDETNTNDDLSADDDDEANDSDYNLKEEEETNGSSCDDDEALDELNIRSRTIKNSKLSKTKLDLSISGKDFLDSQPCWSCFNSHVLCLHVRNDEKTLSDDCCNDVNQKDCAASINDVGQTLSENVCKQPKGHHPRSLSVSSKSKLKTRKLPETSVPKTTRPLLHSTRHRQDQQLQKPRLSQMSINARCAHWLSQPSTIWNVT